MATGDPWIDAYLRFREVVLAGELATRAEVEAYAAELQRGLPGGAPSTPAAMFVTADIAIALGKSSPELMTALWVPR